MKKELLCTIKKFFHTMPGKIVRIIFLLLLTAMTVWMAAVLPLLFREMPDGMIAFFITAAALLYIAGFYRIRYHGILLAALLTLLVYFVTLTPQEQFNGVKFQRVFAVKPEIKYLEDSKFEVINLRKNRYPDNYNERGGEYKDVFVTETFDIAGVQSMQFIEVYWDEMHYVAHNMLNFKFADGRELTVSVEPRTPIGVDRAAFTCLWKQQELLFILGDPADLLDLRSHIRGEDMYIFETTFTPLECQSILRSIISKVYDLYHTPEFYHLTRANCITALLPCFRNARPELKWDIRVILNGYFDRLLWEQQVLEHRPGESFESLKSRSFVKGKSQGKL